MRGLFAFHIGAVNCVNALWCAVRNVYIYTVICNLVEGTIYLIENNKQSNGRIDNADSHSTFAGVNAVLIMIVDSCCAKFVALNIAILLSRKKQTFAVDFTTMMEGCSLFAGSPTHKRENLFNVYIHRCCKLSIHKDFMCDLKEHDSKKHTLKPVYNRWCIGRRITDKIRKKRKVSRKVLAISDNLYLPRRGEFGLVCVCHRKARCLTESSAFDRNRQRKLMVRAKWVEQFILRMQMTHDLIYIST